MAQLLSDEQVCQFHEKGYLFPIDLLSCDEVATARAKLEAFEKNNGGPINGAARSKTHLLFKWIDDMMRDERILDIVAQLIGENILCWNTLFWIKEAGSKSFVSWHQDARYWGLSTNQLVTVWIALSPASESAGCMRVMPESHKTSLLDHHDEYHEDNLLTRGQKISGSIDESKAVSMPLTPGQISLHNVRLAHASGPNTTDERRIGMSFHYMPTDTRQQLVEWDSAALVRGRDDFNYFTHTPIPEADWPNGGADDEAANFHQRASDVVREIVFKDAEARRDTL
ncbi:MAG: phytanoyl-CoA dioxygenase family protein [Pseudomonadota bacterium]